MHVAEPFGGVEAGETVDQLPTVAPSDGPHMWWGTGILASDREMNIG